MNPILLLGAGFCSTCVDEEAYDTIFSALTLEDSGLFDPQVLNSFKP